MNRSLESFHRSRRQTSQRRAWLVAFTVAAACVLGLLSTILQELEVSLAWLWIGAMAVAVGAALGIGFAVSPRRKPIVPATRDEQIAEMYGMWRKGERVGARRR